MNNKKPAPRNRTLILTEKEASTYSKRLISLNKESDVEQIRNKTIQQDIFEAIDFLPDSFIDLLIIDPPYNMNKSFRSTKFKESSIEKYAEWIEKFISKLDRCLKPSASIYFCGEWRSSTSIHLVLSKYYQVHNRITWEREKGRGAKTNWKNNSEDIWFCTKSDEYYFNVNAVKLKRKVLAPYRLENGEPKDWFDSAKGNYRLTFPSNIWTDISIPFWSMAENTDHPTQKPEKLIAKLILASTKPGDFIFDPFLGSGTTSVVAKKLGRAYAGIEIDNKYACFAEKRLELAETDNSIQGFQDGVFWERNTFSERKKK